MNEMQKLKLGLSAMSGDDTDIKNLTDYLKVDLKAKAETCETHGDFQSKNIFRDIWSKCPKCAAEAAAIKQREEAEIEAQKKHMHWQNKLGDAGIPERFKDRTIASYRAIGSGQGHALQFAIDYAENFDDVLKTGRCAIFCGKPGTGKTHLSIGIALAVMEKGKSSLFTTVQRIARRMKETFRTDSQESERDVLSMLIYPDLLIIDEIGVQFGSEFEKNLMFDILNERYEKRKPTLLLSNLTTKEVKVFLGDRIYDRLREDGAKCVPFDWESYRGKHD